MSCRIAGCNKPRSTHVQNGVRRVHTKLCEMHQKRLDRHGDPLLIMCQSCRALSDERLCDRCLERLSKECIDCGELFRFRNRKRCSKCKEENVKLSTARRIIKESKHGKGNWTAAQVAAAHAHCRAYHEVLENEKKIIDKFVEGARAEHAKMLGTGDTVKKFNETLARDHAAKQLKQMRQAGYAPHPELATFHTEVTRVRIK